MNRALGAAACSLALLLLALHIVEAHEDPTLQIADSQPNPGAQEHNPKSQQAEPSNEGSRVLASALPQPNDSGRATILFEDSRLPASGTSWRILQPDGRSQIRIAGNHGEIEVPLGRIRFEHTEEALKTCSPTYEISPKETCVIWVVKLGVMRISVHDEHNRPIPGARVECMRIRPWNPGKPPGREVSRDLTDSMGRLELPTTALSGILVRVGKVGYRDFLTRVVTLTNTLDVILFPEVDYEFIKVSGGSSSGLNQQVEIESDVGFVTYSKSAAGTLMLHMGLHEGKDLRVHAAGYSTITIPSNAFAGTSTPRDPIAVVLTQTGHVSIHASSEPGDIVVWIEVNRDHRRVASPKPVRIENSHSYDLFLPRGSVLSLSAASSSGKIAPDASFPISEQETRIDLKFHQRNPLEIRIDGSHLGSVSEAMVIAEYDGGIHMKILANPATYRFHVGFPERMQGARILVPGHELLKLRRVPSSRPYQRSKGIVIAEPEKSVPVRMKTVTANGNPVPGVRVTLRGNSMQRAFSMHPELHGGWPSGDTNWCWFKQGGRSNITDGEGRTSFWVTPGVYSIDVVLPRSSAGGNPVQYRLVDLGKKIVVNGPAEQVLTVAHCDLVQLAVFDAHTRRPIEAIRVQADVGGLRHGAEFTGRVQTLSLPSRISQVAVSAKGYRTTSVHVSREEITSVELDRLSDVVESPSMVEFIGNAARDLIGSNLTLIGRGVDNRGRKYEAWRTTFEVGLESTDTVRIPFAGPLMLSAIIENPNYEVSVRSPTWVRGRSIQVEARRRQ